MKHASRASAAPLLLSLILSAPLTVTLAISADNTPSAAVAAAAISTLTTESASISTTTPAQQNPEFAFINTIVNKTNARIDEIENAFDVFKDKKDKRKYKVHADEIRILIDAINVDVYTPMSQATLEAPGNKMYQIAWHIVSELRDGLESIYRILDKHRSTTNILNFGTDLKDTSQKLQKRYLQLPAYIDELITLIGKQDLELTGKLLALRVKLNKLATFNGGNALAFLEILRFRKNC